MAHSSRGSKNKKITQPLISVHTPKKHKRAPWSSTPCKNVAVKQYSISVSSVSEIETASSSSGGKLKGYLSSGHTSSGANTKENLHRKKARNIIRKRKIRSLKNTDNEWETASEQSFKESSDDDEEQQYSPKKKSCHTPISNLFEYSTSPEISIRKRGFAEPLSNDKLIVHKEKNVRTYPARRKENYTSNNNQEWDNNNKLQNLTPRELEDEDISDVSSISLSSFHQEEIQNLSEKFSSIPEPIPAGMIIIRGYWDKKAQKWTRTEYSSQQEKRNNEHKTKTCREKTNEKKKTIYLRNSRS